MDHARDQDDPYRPVVRTQRDLEQVWCTLLSPLGFTDRSVWWLFVLPDGHAVPSLVEVAECPERPDRLDDLARVLAVASEGLRHDLADDASGGRGLRVAFLRSRPGRGGVSPADRAWALALHEVARRAGLSCETVHLATDDTVLPLPLDELGVA